MIIGLIILTALIVSVPFIANKIDLDPFEDNYIIVEKSWLERFIEPIVYKLKEDLFFWKNEKFE